MDLFEAIKWTDSKDQVEIIILSFQKGLNIVLCERFLKII